MNKGLKLLFCKQCNKKRFCSKVVIPGTNYRYTCSQGHSWVQQGITAARVALALEELIPKIRKSFERDDMFYRRLMK